MKHKILGLFLLLCALFFISITVAGFVKGLPNLVPEDPSEDGGGLYWVGLILGFLMMGLAIFVLIRNGIRNLRK